MTTRIGAFIHVTLDGFFAGPNGEIDWFKVIKKDAAWEKHTREESQSGGTLLMGRKTYEMMKSSGRLLPAFQVIPTWLKS